MVLTRAPTSFRIYFHHVVIKFPAASHFFFFFWGCVPDFWLSLIWLCTRLSLQPHQLCTSGQGQARCNLTSWHRQLRFRLIWCSWSVMFIWLLDIFNTFGLWTGAESGSSCTKASYDGGRRDAFSADIYILLFVITEKLKVKSRDDLFLMRSLCTVASGCVPQLPNILYCVSWSVMLHSYFFDSVVRCEIRSRTH